MLQPYNGRRRVLGLEDGQGRVVHYNDVESTNVTSNIEWDAEVPTWDEMGEETTMARSVIAEFGG